MASVYHGCVPPAPRIVRKNSLTPQPWKNGGGVTHEVIRVPAEGENFEWRVSVAHIDASGPFSDFAAYDRKMVLLQGAGIELTFSDGTRRSLRMVGDLAEFDGALAADCRLQGGPCVDLNLMVLKSLAASATVRWLGGEQGSLSARASAGESTVIFGIDSTLVVTGQGLETFVLEPWDLCVITDASVEVAWPDCGVSTGRTAVFLATISH